MPEATYIVLENMTDAATESFVILRLEDTVRGYYHVESDGQGPVIFSHVPPQTPTERSPLSVGLAGKRGLQEVYRDDTFSQEYV